MFATNHRTLQHLTIASIVLAACGCSTVTVRSPDGERTSYSREEFAGYVETVFRYQNGVTDNLIIHYEITCGPGNPPAPGITSAEERMVSACRALNETVAARMQGEDPGLLQKLALKNSITECHAAAVALDAALRSEEDLQYADSF